MNKADEEFIKQAFKEGKVEQKGVHLVETSVSAESCQQPITKATRKLADICPSCKGSKMMEPNNTMGMPEYCAHCGGTGKRRVA